MWNAVKLSLRALRALAVENETGQTLVEYALILAVVAAVVVGSLVVLEGGVAGLLSSVPNAL